MMDLPPEAYRGFFENAKGLMCIHDLDGRVLEVNEASAESLGYSLEELRQMTLFDVVLEQYHHELHQYLKAIRAMGKVSGIMRTKHKSGAMRIWLFSNVLEKGSSGTAYVFGNALDITDRYNLEAQLRRNEALLKAFVEYAPAAMAMLDKELRFVTCSSRWLEMFGQKVGDVAGRTITEVFGEVEEMWKEIYKRCLLGAVEKGEYRIQHPGRPDMYLRWEIRPWTGHDGKIGGVMALNEDVTEERMQKEELQRAKRQAEQASLAKSEFLANMSHEIRTPLNGVIGFTDLLLRTELSEGQEQYLTIVNQSANSLLNIINDILDFSKIEAGKLELDVDRCDLLQLSGEASDIVTYQVQRKGLEMLLDLSSELPRYIWADAIRLKQVLINLLGNAVKFTEAGEIELKVALKRKLQGNQATIRFEVRDTGIGIQPEKQGKIFEAFLQEDTSTTKKYGGTGLGLTISNKLLGLMGSRLQLESTPGAGSTFFFDLDVMASYEAPYQGEALPGIRRALVVDDNKNNRTIIRDMLSLKGIPCDEAASGQEAVQKVSKGQAYDVIIMDYYMPGMNGLDAIRMLRDEFEGPAPFVLLHSSAEDDKIIQASRDLDVDARLMKPIKMEEFYRSLAGLRAHDRSRETKTRTPVSNGQAVRILLVEDNEVNIILARTVIANLLPAADIGVARNGKEALLACERLLPDLILMDVQMPEMNGYEATTLLRQRYPHQHIPIIALTAGNVAGEKENCLRAGMDDFIAKPFREDTLVKVFEQWLPRQAFDIDRLKENLGDAATSEAITAILQATALDLERTRTDLQQVKNDNGRLRALAHRLYGTATSAGMTTLAALSRELEVSDGDKDAAPLIGEIGRCLKAIERTLAAL
ncbi:PAS domain-containing hybrid sensor histidine kinase/response regulator [Dinghuibacter silviterrae]|uniref:Sensory/regulatory protein RpfC n=1 Tax=Dinghuibacter silviterrae TaxID=1539049 RepID=A0A4R8DG40_9BACT|nr:PAS domain-containing hybrid sensor histidine kinase/response regulator [Dinghuibacter silviterrae]TDW96583.1 PAS domain S-box-containing protein [Dinghuibacter silviterrae]